MVIELEHFYIDLKATENLIERAIEKMEKNKAAGNDHIHVEMMKANA